MKWEAEEKGYTCNDCYLSMQNCYDKSICCEDETGLCDQFVESPGRWYRMSVKEKLNNPKAMDRFMNHLDIMAIAAGVTETSKKIYLMERIIEIISEEIETGKYKRGKKE